MKKLILIGLGIILNMVPLVSDAQSFYSIRRERSLIVVGGVGSSSYFGELKNPGDYLDAKPTINLGLQYYIHPNINLRTELTYFTLKGDDDKADDSENGRKGRNLSFTSGNFELSATGAVSIFPLGHRFYQRPGFNLYGFAGVGLMYMNPKAKYDGKRHALQPLKTEDVSYSRFQPVIPYGLGVKFKAGPFFNVAVESGWRITFTDYMDDVSTVHPDKSSWTDPIRIALSDRRQEGNPALSPYPVGAKRGNPEKNDGYLLLTFRIEYYLPNNFLMNNNRKLYNVKRKSYRR